MLQTCKKMTPNIPYAFNALEKATWSTCVRCWRAWFLNPTGNNRWNKVLVQRSEILSKIALPVGGHVTDAAIWNHETYNIHCECRCVNSQGTGTGDCQVECARCGSRQWCRQIVICECCSSTDDDSERRRISEFALGPAHAKD